MIFVPTILIAKQPDLGTSILIAASGVFVLFLSGISWRIIGAAGVLLGAFIPVLWLFLMRDYQRTRVLTLFNPESDPLGAGYHIIQSKIAIGSGGMAGKGWMQGTQSQLEFLPERHTDFIFAVIAEEWGADRRDLPARDLPVYNWSRTHACQSGTDGIWPYDGRQYRTELFRLYLC